MSAQNTPSGSTDMAEESLVQLRIERGARVIGAGSASGAREQLGTVEQIVVDRATGALRAVIVRSAEDNAEFELPRKFITSASGDEVHLDIGRADLRAHPEIAAPYDPNQYTAVETGEAVPTAQAEQTALHNEEPVITSVEANAVEIVSPPSALNDSESELDTVTLPYPAVSTAQTQPVSQSSAPSTATPQTLLERETLKPAPQATPTIKTSSLSSVEGDLIGGKPSTGGSGMASSVPSSTPSSSAGLDNDAPVTDGSVVTMSDSNLSRPIEQQNVVSTTPVPLTSPQAATTPMPSSSASWSPTSTPNSVAWSPVTGTTGDAAWWNTPWAKGLAAAGLSVGVTAGAIIALRQRRASLPTDQLFDVARRASKATSRGASKAQQSLGETFSDSLSGLSEQAAQLKALTQKASERTVRQSAKTQESVGKVLQRLAEQTRVGTKAARDTVQDSLTSSTTDAIKDTAKDTAKVTARKATKASAAAAVTAKAAGKGAKRGVKRTARRARWFRNGMLVGAVLAVFFAPEPGALLREQIATRVEQLRARLAS